MLGAVAVGDLGFDVVGQGRLLADRVGQRDGAIGGNLGDGRGDEPGVPLLLLGSANGATSARARSTSKGATARAAMPRA
jgi:hypothetical protein